MLDITIIKPVIESCIGEDLITGEDLTDMERGLKVVFAMVDLVTLGGAIAATKFSEMGLKEGLKAFGKTALIDFAGNTAACGVEAPVRGREVPRKKVSGQSTEKEWICIRRAWD